MGIGIRNTMGMKRLTLATLVLLLLYQEACDALEIRLSANPAAAGRSVTLSLSPPTSLSTGSWAVGDMLILTWSGDQVAFFSNHTGRASMDADRALTLNSLSEEDSGVYTMKSTEAEISASVSLTVLDPVSNVTANGSGVPLIENSSTAVASCSVSSGSSVSLLWFKGSSEVTANHRVQLSEGNSTLTIAKVNRHDQGPFTCAAFNPVSNATSNAVNFTVFYGPDNMNLTLGSHITGSNVTAVCTAECNPPAQMQWAFRGQLLNTSGPVLELYNVTKDQSGSYSCFAFNNETNLRQNITGHLEVKDSASQPTAAWLLPLLSIIGMVFTFF